MERGTREERREPRPSWNRLLPYARLLREDLTPSTDPAHIREQEALLLRQLKELQAELEAAQTGMQALFSSFGVPGEEPALEGLQRLSRLAQSRGGLDFYRAARRQYPAPQDLAEDLTRLRQIRGLSAQARELIAARVYLETVTLGEEDAELAVDRASLLDQLAPKELMANPRLATSLLALFQWFQARFRNAYLGHHEQYHQRLEELRRQLERLGAEVEALERLNRITELGPAVGEGLAIQHQALLQRTQPCPAPDQGALERVPFCPRCRLRLTDAPPYQEVARFTEGLEAALLAQQRRLSAEAIRQILGRSQEDRILRFLQVVQAADLSALVNVLDDSLVDFIQQLLAKAGAYAPAAPAQRRLREPSPAAEEAIIYSPRPAVLHQLRERFITVSEEEVESVAMELSRLLRQALAEGRQHRPGRRIRVRLR